MNTRGLVLGLMLVPAACGGGAVAPWTAAPAVPLDLRVQVAPAEVPLLAPVQVTFDLWAAAADEAEFAPTFVAKDFLVGATTTTRQPLFGGQWQHTVVQLRPRRGPGELVLPSFVVTAKSGDATASTPEQKLVVTSTLAGHGEAIEAPGAPFPTPFCGWWWVAGGAGALLLGAALVWSLRRRRRRALTAPAAVALPPHVRALRALQRLHEAPRTTAADVEAFYVGVSNVLRVYLEERFGLRAPERTTEEFLRDLEGGDGLARAHRPELERFLRQCDLVKFAAVVPTEQDHRTTLGLAEAFVDSTRPDRTPTATAEVGA
ncbi:MAG: hypothetical protein IT455_19315 [Planctomycetes bacterium]|nr:hypothetical protein [Planctomycetota bacterium]